MANWQYTLNISSIWNESMTFEEKGRAVARKIKRTFPKSWLDWSSEDHDPELEEIVEFFDNITGFEDVSPVEEFDMRVDNLYDWCDQEVAPLGQWPPNKMCWVETG